MTLTDTGRLLVALGHDVDAIIAERRTEPYAGLLVRDLEGRAIRFYTERVLRRKQRDPDFVRRFEALASE